MPGLPQPPKRFNLLLLDEGEFYFDDYPAVYYPPLKRDRYSRGSVSFEDSVKRRVEGRIKLCSASILFVPKVCCGGEGGILGKYFFLPFFFSLSLFFLLT